MSNPNANVRKFDGAVNAAAYWIYDHLLRAGDIVNDSTVTGTTVKAALNTLSAASSAVFPFVAAGLAEQDLVSYDATAGTWKNRTKAAALKGTGTDSFVVGTGSFAAGTNDIILGPSSGNVLNTGSGNIGIGTDVLDGATAALSNVVAIGTLALTSALQASASGSVGIGNSALRSLTTGTNVAIGDSALYSVTTGDNNVGVGAGAMLFSNATQCVCIGFEAMAAAVCSATGTVGIGRRVLYNLTSGDKVVAVGFGAGTSVTTGSRVSLFGYSTNSASGSDDNTFIGDEIGSTSVGSRNTALGSLAFNSASAAVTDCVAIGYNALTGVISSTGPSGSVAIGSTALQAITTGLNTAIGFAAGLTLTTGTGNTIVGESADGSANSRSGCVILGKAASATVDNTLVIRVGNSSTTELKTDLAVTAGVGVAIGAEPYITFVIGGVSYKIALRS